MPCPCSVAFDFFEKFSVLFAEAAQGVIFFLGYGERVNGTFSESSFFAKYEIPNLNPAVVTRVVVIVVHRRNKGKAMLCSIGPDKLCFFFLLFNS